MYTFLDFVRTDLTKLLQRSQLIGMFTYLSDRPVYPAKPKYEGGIVFKNKTKNIEDSTYGFYVGDKFFELKKSPNSKFAPFHIYDRISPTSRDLANIKGTVDTTIGRFLTNYVLLVNLFKDLVPYINTPWNLGKTERLLASYLMEDKITPAQYKQYIDNGYKILHMGELFVPTISEKSVTIDKKIIDERDKLLAQNKDKLTDPKVVAIIEDKLIKMYSDSIVGDPAERYFGADPTKTLKNNAKKINIMVGGIDDFGGEAGTVVTNGSSLAEGWERESFPAVSNEIRKGSYSRGKETQDGGAITKSIFRAFQDVLIAGDDCGTTEGLEVIFDDVVTPNLFLGRYLIIGKKEVLVMTDMFDDLKGKKVIIRSPMYCKSKVAICFKCAGEFFKKLDITSPGTLAIGPSSSMMLGSMKAMHGTTLKLKDLVPEDFFVEES